MAEKFSTTYALRYKSEFAGKRSLPSLGLAKVITDRDNTQLLKIPDAQEIKDALFSIDSIKTPGPDGFGADFFKQNWALLRQDFTNCVLEFFRNGKILKEINHPFITLILKWNNPSTTYHYRPISLCSTIYKTISKILVNRLHPLLDKLVSPF